MLCAPFTATWSDDSDTATYEVGLARMNHGDAAGAISQFQQVIQLDANHLPARVALGASTEAVFPLLGNALLAQRKYAALLDTIKSPGTPAADNFEITVLRGRAQFERGAHALAAQDFERATLLAPERVEPLLGQACWRLRKVATNRPRR